jgi:cardiolipin synthase
MKRKKTWLYASRFAIIFFSIIAQAATLWILFVLLGRKFAIANVVSSGLGVLLFLYVVNKDQPAVYKLPWVILILLAPLAGLVIYYTFGNVRISRKTMKKFRRIYDDHHDEYYNQSDVLNEMEEKGGKFIGVAKYVRNVTSLPIYKTATKMKLAGISPLWKAVNEERRIHANTIPLAPQRA